MNVGFVGKGRVAKSFSKFLEDKGVRVVGFHTRSVPNAKMLEQCDLLFIATPDDQIGIAAESLSTSAAFICHFSGALSSDVLLPLKRDGVTIASLHPAMTFTEQTDLTGVPFAFEGSGSRLEEFTAFLRSLDIDFFQIDTASKPLYHAAMCNISNHITCLVYMTEVMLKELHINEKKL